VHRSIVGFDIEKSTSAPRTNPIKQELRDELYRMIEEAMTVTGIGTEHCDPFEDRGDGLLALIHPIDEIPKAYILSRLLPELTRLLAERNRGLPAAEQARRQIRLRAVVHAGEVHHDDRGCFGEALDLACRLLDAARLKRQLRTSTEPLALVVSEDIYWGVVKHEYDGIREAAFRPAIAVNVAGRHRQGWIHVPGCDVPPALHLTTQRAEAHDLPSRSVTGG
jgi:hypothetical protein